MTTKNKSDGPFKIGHLVRCIDSRNLRDVLTEGKLYRVIDMQGCPEHHGEFEILVDNKTVWFRTKRFEEHVRPNGIRGEY